MLSGVVAVQREGREVCLPVAGNDVQDILARAAWKVDEGEAGELEVWRYGRYSRCVGRFNVRGHYGHGARVVK